MPLTHLPVPLMTAAERAGFVTAVSLIRAEGERMRRAARLIGATSAEASPADAIHQQQKNQILDLCGRAVEMCCDRAERDLPRGVTLAGVAPALLN